PTPGSYIKVKVGADKTGKLTAAEAYLAYEAGAFPGSPIWAGCVCIFSCYDIPNLLINGYDVCVNKPATSAYRAPGATNAAIATGGASVSRVAGSTDIGGTRTRIATQLAARLRIRAADVKPSVADTDSVAYTDVTGGSRVTYTTGWAAFEAAKDIQRQMID